ncbi:MAG: DNA recombination protein RmuC [Gammaproteobacteria bacterium]|nr:DNA recombination protein RmuC [Gammaproteobacteria bacterium]
MQNLFSHDNLTVILLFLTFVALVILIIALRRILSSHPDKISQELNNLLSQLSQSLNENQRQTDEKLTRNQQQLFENIMEDRVKQLNSMSELRVELEKRFAESHQKLSESVNNFGQKISQTMEQYQSQTQQSIIDNIRKGIAELRNDLDRSLKLQTESIEKSILGLTESTDNRLKDISGQVEKRLNEGFEKTNKTFNDVIKRLALIDDAQKKITELSGNVVSLQEILNDKRSRGAFGEIQLLSLVSNIMPENHYKMQATLSNEKIADCLLLLPEPTGSIAIDAKFPLESYKKMMDISLAQSDRDAAQRQFSKDVKKHINDISDKYILPPETSDGAVMFIPAESVFAEIHGHFPDLVELAYQKKVWMVSPTTLMAILTTASTVIKDEQTRKQVHIIKEHLSALGKDFGRFQSRMDSLSKHIGQVSKDVDDVSVSAKKITSRFEKIERVEIKEEVEELEVDKITKHIK